MADKVDRVLYQNTITNKSSLKIMNTVCNTISCTSRYCGQALGYCAQDACDKSSSGRALGGVSLDNQSTEIFAILQTSLAAKVSEASMGAAYFIWRVNGYCYYVACGNCRVLGVQHTSPKSGVVLFALLSDRRLLLPSVS